MGKMSDCQVVDPSSIRRASYVCSKMNVLHEVEGTAPNCYTDVLNRVVRGICSPVDTS